MNMTHAWAKCGIKVSNRGIKVTRADLSICDTKQLKALVWHKHFTVNASNEIVTSELLLYDNYVVIMNHKSIDQDRNNNNNIEDEILNSAF